MIRQVDFLERVCYNILMATVAINNTLLEHILSEVRTLRREVSLFMPSESLKDYNNASDIKAAYRKAASMYPLHGSH